MHFLRLPDILPDLRTNELFPVAASEEGVGGTESMRRSWTHLIDMPCVELLSDSSFMQGAALPVRSSLLAFPGWHFEREIK